MTVASHGARIVTGDGNGIVKWFERDGRKLARAYVVEPPDRRKKSEGLWESARATTAAATGRGLHMGGGIGDEVIRKVIVVNQGGEELIVWAGDRVGVLGTFGAEEAEVEAEEENVEKVYLRKMREVLERQAEEVRIMAGLGQF